MGEKLGGIVGACNCQPEYEGKQKKHKGIAGFLACQKSIYLLVLMFLFIRVLLDNLLTDCFRPVKEGGGNEIRELLLSDTGSI